MYDWPELRQHTDAFWQGYAKHAGQAGNLDRTTEYVELWRNPKLDFSQTCGYPFTHEFKGLLNYIATPHYACAGCDDATYSSFVFAREVKPLKDFRGKTAAINSTDSMSGMLALKLAFAPFVDNGEFFERKIMTGGHLNSLRAVREGKADVCAIDAVAANRDAKTVASFKVDFEFNFMEDSGKVEGMEQGINLLRIDHAKPNLQIPCVFL